MAYSVYVPISEQYLADFQSKFLSNNFDVSSMNGMQNDWQSSDRQIFERKSGDTRKCLMCLYYNEIFVSFKKFKKIICE